MTTPSPADAAVAVLASLPPLGDLTSLMTFTAVGQSTAGELGPYKIGLTADAQESIAEIAQDTRERLGDGTLLAYEPAALIPPQYWMHVPVRDAATLLEIDEMVRRDDTYPFNGRADDAPTIKLIAAHFRHQKASITFYRIADSLLELRKAKVVGLFQEGDTFKKLEPSDVLILRHDFDVVVIDQIAFFRKKATFERAFGFFDELRSASQATFTAVTAHLRIRGIEELRKACTSEPQMMAKMASIKRSMDEDEEYAKVMTMANLVDYISKHPHIDIEIAGAGINRELVFDNSAARRFQILKLLDDDFLRSALTKREYEAGSKFRTAIS